jgi:excisionase family DNA binding protein
MVAADTRVGADPGEGLVISKKWHTVAEVAEMLGYGETKVRMLVINGDLKSLKDGRARRILPEWVDEYVAKRAAEAEAGDRPFGSTAA